MQTVSSILFGDWQQAAAAGLKALGLFLTAAIAFRLTERRTLAEFAPFDWVAAVAVGAIVGRTATARDTSWLTGVAALLTLLVAHTAVARLRYLPRWARLIDPPLRILIRDGVIDRRNLRHCGLTEADLQAILRQHGHRDAGEVELAVFEAKGAVSVLRRETPSEVPGEPGHGST